MKPSEREQQLWDYWSAYAFGRWDNAKAEFEVRMWQEQHCVDATDDEFDLAVAMRQYLADAPQRNLWVL